MESFDELMDDFLNSNKGSLAEEARKTIEEFKNITDEKELNKKIFQKFGEPTQIVKVVQEGVEVVQFIWKRPEGTFFTTYTNQVEGETYDIDKIWETIYNTITDKAGIVIADYTNKPVDLGDDNDLTWLNHQLDEAIKVEDYQKAAKLRDKINAKKNEQPK